MVAVFRVLGLGVLLLAIVLHVVGFVTHNWVVAELDMRDNLGVMSAIRLIVNLGLWEICLKPEMAPGFWAAQEPGRDMSGQQSSDEGQLSQDSLMGQESSPSQDAMSGPSSGTGGLGIMCHRPDAYVHLIPDWMKAVHALGILSLLVGAVALVFMIYSCVGDSKGDRARLLPYTIGAASLAAGVLLMIGVIVYGSEYAKMVLTQTSTLDDSSPFANAFFRYTTKNTRLGYSFVLEGVSAALFIIASLIMVIPLGMGWGDSLHLGGPRNVDVKIFEKC